MIDYGAEIESESEKLLDSNRLVKDEESVETPAVIQWQFDEAMEKVGFGKYQFFLWGPLALVAMSCGFNNMMLVFEGGVQNHTCATPENITTGPNHTLYFAGKCSYNKTVMAGNTTISTENEIICNEWVYDRSVLNTTIDSEWNLTCSREYLVNLSATIYMLGFFTGCVILSDLADRFGRRTLLLLSALLTLIAGVGAAFSPDYEVFTALRFFVGMGVAGTRNSSYILITELARARDRGTLGLISDMTYSVAYILTGLIFWLDPNWRHFQMYISLSHIIYLTYIFFIPESPRWLITNHQEAKALQYFRTSAYWNNKKMPDNVTVFIDQPPRTKHSPLDLVRTPNLRLLGGVCAVLWFLVSLIYFGMSYNVSNLPGSLYVNNVYFGAVELVANCLGIWVVRIGRRKAIVASYILSSITMATIIFTQSSFWATIVLAMLGKLMVSPLFSFIYITTAELYPTQTRTLALGLGSGLARLGGALAPFIQYSYQVWNVLPYIIFTVCGVIGAVTGTLLPETMGRPLPDSIESAERMNELSVRKCCRRKRSLRYAAMD